MLNGDDSQVPAQPIGTLIAKRRHVLGLSQQQLAARVGVARDTVSMWERNRQFPHRHLGKLEDVLGISLAENGTEPQPPTDPRERELWALLMATYGLTPAEAQKFVEEARRAQRRAG